MSFGATSSFAGAGLSSLRTLRSLGTTAAGAVCFGITLGSIGFASTGLGAGAGGGGGATFSTNFNSTGFLRSM
jgi:hypothetical protein